MTSAVIQFIGSIRLAIPLLLVIGSILIGATFYESEVGSSVVQQEIYKSPWFGALMFLLAFNLSVSTLLRYPWKGARKIGFAMAHWGLVVIIAGSAAVIHLSVEGMLLARTDGGPVSTLRVEGDLLEVASPGQELQQTSLFIKDNGTVVPDHLGNLSLLGYTNHAIKTVQFRDGAAIANPAVRLSLSSNRMGQTLERWLAVAPANYDRMDIGPAELQIKRVDSDQELQTELANSQQKTGAAWGTLTLQQPDGTQTIDVKSSLHQAVVLDRVNLTVKEFWPDFRLDENGQPETATQQLRNPAVQLELSTDNVTERWFIFGNPDFQPIRTQLAGNTPLDLDIHYDISADAQPDAFFKVLVDSREQLHYAAKSSKGFKSGPLALGEPVTPGWADFKITLEEYVPRANVERAVVALPVGNEGGEPALQVATAEGQTRWIPWGEPTTMETPDGSWYLAFSPKLMRLPFALKLNDFIVERNEGSESVAMWTSLVTLMEPITGELSERRVWMNHPTWFKGWKIAQASWNPGDLAQSTLQVKREPWWVTGLTWLGSLMVTMGVATMFYGRAVAKKLKFVNDLLDSPESDKQPEEAATIPIFSFFSSR
ncbi:cytochrome c biogenesis protein ResB [Leptolyngbya cf. ectocarpi LEGE 11479]|uniref:Cytochrome c biogenesis protein ResB n=1 Tax=Leptolyngbya cf. ectocarpi LEGE 11479 TaxID=1828722 RepID=A0A929F9E0_LEPEC|nr:cytochrome c biogenesis protein ResB [Leptolyngbya ectocarpi]MBE9067822.1 cytochrome c biogenesis protein ResB [Leptolyngbya cf. ectocarpi LEGE 11479]